MKKPTRYLVYLGIGMAMYYLIYDGEESQSLEEFHSIAPAIILGLVVVMMVLRFIKSKKENRNE